MKKKLFLTLIPLLILITLVTPKIVLGQQSVNDVIGQVTPPPAVSSLGFGGAGIGQVLGNIITIIYAVSGIIFVFMVIISAFQMITSGGDKEAVSKARGRLTYAIIGITLLALALFITNVLGRLTGFKFPITQK